MSKDFNQHSNNHYLYTSIMYIALFHKPSFINKMFLPKIRSKDVQIYLFCYTKTVGYLRKNKWLLRIPRNSKKYKILSFVGKYPTKFFILNKCIKDLCGFRENFFYCANTSVFLCLQCVSMKQLNHQIIVDDDIVKHKLF